MRNFIVLTRPCVIFTQKFGSFQTKIPQSTRCCLRISPFITFRIIKILEIKNVIDINFVFLNLLNFLCLKIYKRLLARSSSECPISVFAELYYHRKQSCVQIFDSKGKREVGYSKRGFSSLAVWEHLFSTFQYKVVVLSNDMWKILT